MSSSALDRDTADLSGKKRIQTRFSRLKNAHKKQYNASSRKTKQSGLKSRNIHFEKRGKRKMKVIHKISPVLILAGYFYVLYEGYFLCQFGGVRYHGQKMAVGAAVMAVGFLFWLITRKKAKEQQAGKKTISVDRRTCGSSSGNDHLWRCGDPHGNPIQWGTLLEN